MKAIRIHSYGGPEVLAQVEMQRPAPGANEILIKVHAASVNPFDWKARAGYVKELFPLTFSGNAWFGCFRNGRRGRPRRGAVQTRR